MAENISEIWSDLDHRLLQDSEGNLKKVINVQSVLTSIDNIIRTYKGGRVMLPEFASNLRSIVFESMNETMLDFVSRDMKDTIERWDDRVVVSQVKFLAEPDYSSISLTILFGIKGFSKVFKWEAPIKGEI